MAMASKHRQRRLSNLRRSFVVTLSTATASLAGCDDSQPIINPPPPPPPWVEGGSGGNSGAGGVGGSGGGQPPDWVCPDMPPPFDGDCERSSSQPCTYQDLEQCDGVSYPLIATCENGFWSISQTIIACNPPEPDIDSGLDDEDAGN
jgi:hypothetical protein